MKTIKIIFYKKGDYKPYSLEYPIPDKTAERIGTSFITHNGTFRALYGPILRKLRANVVTAYIRES